LSALTASSATAHSVMYSSVVPDPEVVVVAPLPIPQAEVGGLPPKVASPGNPVPPVGVTVAGYAVTPVTPLSA
jgi:hypothetical protein